MHRFSQAISSVAFVVVFVCGCNARHGNEQVANGSAAGSGGTAASMPSQGSGGAHAAAASGGAPAISGGAGSVGSGGAAETECVPSTCGQPMTDASVPATPGSDAGARSQTDAGPASSLMPDAKYLVPATGPCPEFANGYATFHPDNVERSVLLFMSDAAKTLDGPLIFSWHSTLPGPETANVWLGDAQIEEIKAQGGIVAAPSTGYPNETRPWDSTPAGATGDNDQLLMDEVVACAIEKVGIDVRRIHAIGMSAGGLKTAQVSVRRSGYIASVVVYSGGFVEGDDPPDQDPDNAFAAMILYGGASDISPVDGIDYLAASMRYRDALRAKGRFAFLCDHGGGHSVPQDSQASAWQFMQDHPFGVSPSPYAMALPAGFLSYCSL
jgi:predicted esterase